MFADHYQFIMLVKTFHQLGDNPESRFLMFLLFFIGNLYPDGIMNKNRPGKTKPLIAIGHGDLINQVGSKTDCHCKDQGAMRHPLFKGLGFAPLGIHMMGKKITGLPGVNNNIRFGDGPAKCLADFIYNIFLKIFPDKHGNKIVSGNGGNQEINKNRPEVHSPKGCTFSRETACCLLINSI